MKRCMIALVAMTMAAAVHAVTYSWSNTSGSNLSSPGNDNLAGNGFNLTLAKLTQGLGNLPTSGKVVLDSIAVADRGDGGHYRNLQVTDAEGKVHTATYKKEGTMTITLTDGTTITRNRVVYQFTDLVLDVNTSYQFKPVTGDSTSGVGLGVTSFKQPSGTAEGGPAINWDNRVAAMELEAHSVPLPEPTALALLALGAAGLALRRRVA